MTSDFRKIVSKNETRYVLESASVGGTSSGSVASVSAPLGKIRKRSDNILAQETDDDPCWKDYKQLGTKKKNGKTVPNCVPKESVEESAPPGFPEDLMMKLKNQYPENPERAFATAWAIHKKQSRNVNEESLEDLQKEFEFVYNPKRRQLYVYPKGLDTTDIGNSVAWIGLDYAGKGPDGEVQYASSDTMVQRPYQRRGIATAMYQYLRQQGVPIVSSVEQTSQGSSMWKSFRAKGLASGDKFLEDPYFEELSNALEARLKPNDPVDVWKQDFQTADPNKYHQFKNKTPEKKDQMAISAHYKARQPIATKK